MKQPEIFNRVFISLVLVGLFFTGSVRLHAQTSAPTPAPITQCNDGIDNDGDNKADFYGVYNPDGSLKYEPDPSCFDKSATVEKGDVVVSKIIPCTDKCTFSDIFRLINNILNFFITTLLIPIFIIIIMYAGYKYIRAQGNSSKKANLVKTLGNIVLGLVLVLCAWLIVHTVLTLLGYSEGLLFFQ